MVGLVARIDRFMAAHPWDHNQHYHRWLLRQMPASFDRALDVGCGRGELARLMATRARRVDAIDTDPSIVGAAEEATPAGLGVSFSNRSLLDVSERYDVITAVAALHHLDLVPALRVLRSALTPGGRLLVVGCYREATPIDHAITALAVPLNMAIGSAKNAGLRRPPSTASVAVRTQPPTTTVDDVRSVVRRELPGARVRRALFWRYLLTYRAGYQLDLPCAQPLGRLATVDEDGTPDVRPSDSAFVLRPVTGTPSA